MARPCPSQTMDVDELLTLSLNKKNMFRKLSDTVSYSWDHCSLTLLPYRDPLLRVDLLMPLYITKKLRFQAATSLSSEQTAHLTPAFLYGSSDVCLSFFHSPLSQIMQSESVQVKAVDGKFLLLFPKGSEVLCLWVCLCLFFDSLLVTAFTQLLFESQLQARPPGLLLRTPFSPVM